MVKNSVLQTLPVTLPAAYNASDGFWSEDLRYGHRMYSEFEDGVHHNAHTMRFCFFSLYF